MKPHNRISIKGIWFVLIMYAKRLIREILKAIWRFLSKKRYIKSYKIKKRILIVFLIINNIYIIYTCFTPINTKETIVIERVGVSVSSSEVADAYDSPDDIAEQSDLIGEEMTESPSDSPDVSVGEFSAYNAEIGQTDSDPFTMASGKKVYEGAVANNCLPFGSKIELNGKIYTVEDRMNKRYGCEHFDLFFNSYAEAIEFGRQELEYSIIS